MSGVCETRVETELKGLEKAVRPLQEALATHRLYTLVETLDDVRTFMEYHVFAVWDFMSLLKALQRELTCTSLPWVPRCHPMSRRLINAIVLEEESDEDGEGGYLSHFEIYRLAMEECGADTSQIDRFLVEIQRGHTVVDAVHRARIPDISRHFVETTWAIVESGSSHRIAAAFSLGREDIIPDMFRSLIGELQRWFPERLSRFQWYLDRHVELDQEHHGPMATQMLVQLCGDDPETWHEAKMSAVAALRARVALWDALAIELERAPTVGHLE